MRTVKTMTPDQVQLLKRLVLNDSDAVNFVMSGAPAESTVLDARTDALVRITALLSCCNSDPTTFQWATEIGLAAGLTDDELFHALMLVAPIIGVARLTSVLPHLMSALDIDILE